MTTLHNLGSSVEALDMFLVAVYVASFTEAFFAPAYSLNRSKMCTHTCIKVSSVKSVLSSLSLIEARNSKPR